jgi:hypothetical protein
MRSSSCTNALLLLYRHAACAPPPLQNRKESPSRAYELQGHVFVCLLNRHCHTFNRRSSVLSRLSDMGTFSSGARQFLSRHTHLELKRVIALTNPRVNLK